MAQRAPAKRSVDESDKLGSRCVQCRGSRSHRRKTGGCSLVNNPFKLPCDACAINGCDCEVWPGPPPENKSKHFIICHYETGQTRIECKRGDTIRVRASRDPVPSVSRRGAAFFFQKLFHAKRLYTCHIPDNAPDGEYTIGKVTVVIQKEDAEQECAPTSSSPRSWRDWFMDNIMKPVYRTALFFHLDEVLALDSVQHAQKVQLLTEAGIQPLSKPQEQVAIRKTQELILKNGKGSGGMLLDMRRSFDERVLWSSLGFKTIRFSREFLMDMDSILKGTDTLRGRPRSLKKSYTIFTEIGKFLCHNIFLTGVYYTLRMKNVRAAQIVAGTVEGPLIVHSIADRVVRNLLLAKHVERTIRSFQGWQRYVEEFVRTLPITENRQYTVIDMGEVITKNRLVRTSTPSLEEWVLRDPQLPDITPHGSNFNMMSELFFTITIENSSNPFRITDVKVYRGGSRDEVMILRNVVVHPLPQESPLRTMKCALVAFLYDAPQVSVTAGSQSI